MLDELGNMLVIARSEAWTALTKLEQAKEAHDSAMESILAFENALRRLRTANEVSPQ